MSVPAFAIGVPASVDERDVAATLASLDASARRVGCSYEHVVAVNGPGDVPPAVCGVREFAAAAGLPLREVAVADDGDRAPDSLATDARDEAAGAAVAGSAWGVTLVRLPRRSKVAAWNAIRRATAAPIIVFADADVRVAPEALPLLIGVLATEPALAAVAGREHATVVPDDGLVARVAALPYRFDFGNVPGRLYALRTAALPERMPACVLAEDAYLTVRLGRDRFAKESGAIVYLRPPTTWRDYLRQRVRHEVGKLQLTREFADLRRRHGFGRYPWRAFARAITLREYPLVALSLVARAYARARALAEIRAGFPTGWAMLPSTKRWTDVPATLAPCERDAPPR
jgi:Glycosyl transferase family 2